MSLLALPLTRVKPSAKMDAMIRANFIVVLKIWGDGVVGPRGEYRRVLLRQECEHAGIYVARPPRPPKPGKAQQFHIRPR